MILQKEAPHCMQPPAMLGDRSHCGGDIRHLIGHATLPEYMMKGSCDFKEGSSSL